jgi:hypothetical protein
VNSKLFSACLVMQRTYNIQSTQAAARMGQLRGDNRYLDWAAAQLDIYRQIYLTNTDRTRGAMFIQLLDEATVTTALTDSVRLLRPYVGDSRAGAWCRDLLKPMAYAMLGARQQASNITVWYDVAAAMAGMECGDLTLVQEAQGNSTFGLSKLFDVGLSGDGFWYELSPQYQAYVTQALTQVLVSASLHNETARFQPLWPRLQSMLLAPNALGLGNNEGPLINDANKAGVFPDPGLFLETRRVLSTQLGLRLAASTLGWPQLLDPPSSPAASALPMSTDTSTRWVDGARSLVLRDGAWAGVLRGGQLATFHAHQDTLSIELKHGNTWLFRNSVTPGYGSELQRNFYKLAAAVSTPLVDGNGTSNWFRPLASYRAEQGLVSAKLTAFAKDVNVDRTLSVDATGALRDVATFSTTETLARVFAQLYHSDCVLPDFAPPSNKASSVQKVSPYLLNWEVLSQKKKFLSFRMTCDGKTFLTTLSASRPFSLWRANGPALAPARRRMALLVELDPGLGATVETRIVASY